MVVADCVSHAANTVCPAWLTESQVPAYGRLILSGQTMVNHTVGADTLWMSAQHLISARVVVVAGVNPSLPPWTPNRIATQKRGRRMLNKTTGAQ